MSLDNLIHVEFTEEEIQQTLTHLAAIEAVFANKTIALTPEQRREYGRLGNNNGPWVNRVHSFMKQRPDFLPAFINLEEFEVDKAAQEAITPIITRIEALQIALDDTLKLVGSDLYSASIAYYRNIKLLAAQNVPGAKPIFDDLKVQFPGTPSKKSSKSTE